MGRPTKFTPETTAKLVQAISLGAPYVHACNYAGVSYAQFRVWMKRGEAAKKGKFAEFFATIKEAEGRATVGWLAKIEKAANEGNWQAAAWKLERRYPSDFGRRDPKSDEPEDGTITLGISTEAPPPGREAKEDDD